MTELYLYLMIKHLDIESIFQDSFDDGNKCYIKELSIIIYEYILY